MFAKVEVVPPVCRLMKFIFTVVFHSPLNVYFPKIIIQFAYVAPFFPHVLVQQLLPIFVVLPHISFQLQLVVLAIKINEPKEHRTSFKSRSIDHFTILLALSNATEVISTIPKPVEALITFLRGQLRLNNFTILLMDNIGALGYNLARILA
jgi:hypothetical protein